MSQQPSPNRPRDLSHVSIRLADNGSALQNTRQNFYISPNRTTPIKRIPSPLQSSFSLDSNDSVTSPGEHSSSLRSASPATSTSTNPYAPPPLQIPTSATSAPSDTVSPTGSNPSSPHRVKGAAGDKDFDSVKAIATRHALLEKSRAVRDGGVHRQLHKAPSESASAPQLQVTGPSPALASQDMASAPIPVRLDTSGARAAALDSTMSLSSSPSSAFQAQLPLEDPDSVDVPALIAAAGSPEAAIRKLLREKHTTAQNNAQLWRLLNKQKTMVIDLNKDLQRAVKDKERYRKKLKDQLLSSASGLPGGVPLEREGSNSPSIITSLDEVPPSGSRIASLASDDYLTHNSPSSGSHNPHSPNSSVSPMYATPAPVPFALGTESRASTRSGDSGSNPSSGVPEYRIPTGSPAALFSSNVSNNTGFPALDGYPQGYQESDARPGSLSQRQKQGSFSASVRDRNNSIGARKAPPAPLDLGHRPIIPARSTSSDYDSGSPMGRAASARSELDDSKLARGLESAKSRPGYDREEPANSVLSSPGDYSSMDDAGSPQVATVQTYQSLNALHSSVKTPSAAEHNADVKRSLGPAPSPGLPASPRPLDRVAKTAPTRPDRSPAVGSPSSATHALFPRTHLIAHPTAVSSLSGTMPLLNRSTSSQQSVPQIQKDSRHLAPQDSDPSTSESSSLIGAFPMPSPGIIFKGFVTDHFPGLLLPPSALPQIHVKVDSSRLRPSRMSYMAPKQSEENPVFSLAVHKRSDDMQLWRVEKTLNALAQLDSDLKACSKFKMKLPDRALFMGHAPARIDARRSALAAYFGHMLDTHMDEKASNVVCAFFSSDAIGIEASDYFSMSQPVAAEAPPGPKPKPKPRKAGYLTKKGKNFGGWKARYFVLDGPILKYFEAPGGAQLGTIKLQHASIGRQTGGAQEGVEEENQFRHAFLIMEPKRKDKQSHIQHVLCAESDEERDNWVRCLMKYVDDDESQRPKTATKSSSDRLGPTSSPKPSKSMGDMRKNVQPISQEPVPAPDFGGKLRAVKYDNTIAAEAPVLGPSAISNTPAPSQPTGVTLEDLVEKNAPHPMISGPTNGAVIQNASSWGNKREPNLLTKDRTKRMDSVKDQNPPRERKRSIFAFSGRVSSDSGNRESMLAGQSNDPIQIRPVFGIPLAEAVEMAPPRDSPVLLPAVVYRCLEFLRVREAVLEEGIFRMSGSNVVIKALRERFNTEGDVKLIAPSEQPYDIHAVASLLKLYLRELPATILTRELHLDFVKCLELDEKTRSDAYNLLVNRMPPANRELLSQLTAFLRDIVDHESVNKMNVRNVGIVFSPTLNIPGPLITVFVTDHNGIFGVPVNPKDVDSSLLAMLSDSRQESRPAVPDLPSANGTQRPERPEAPGGPSITQDFTGADYATAQRMAKEAYDTGYTGPPSAKTPTGQQYPVPLRNPSLQQIQNEDSDSDQGANAHTSFHSMHFPDPPMTARIPQQGESSHSSPRSPNTMSSASSTSTLTNGARDSSSTGGASTFFNKKSSIINLNDINISFSPLMGGTSPEFNRGGFGAHNAFVPSNLTSSMSAGQIPPPSAATTPITPTMNTSQSGPVGNSAVPGSSIPSTKYSELQSAGSPTTPRSASLQSVTSAGSGASDGSAGGSTGSSFGRRLLRRQSGAFLVRAGLIDDKSSRAKVPEGAPSPKGFVPGGAVQGLGVEGAGRNGGFGRKE